MAFPSPPAQGAFEKPKRAHRDCVALLGVEIRVGDDARLVITICEYFAVARCERIEQHVATLATLSRDISALFGGIIIDNLDPISGWPGRKYFGGHVNSREDHRPVAPNSKSGILRYDRELSNRLNCGHLLPPNRINHTISCLTRPHSVAPISLGFLMSAFLF